MNEQYAKAPLLGRDGELTELVAGLDEADRGRGRLLLVGGEPGIGKSRLANELAARARDRDHLVLWGRGWEDAGAPPYWLWVQVLRAYVRNAPADVVRRQIGPGASDILQMLPELGELFPGLAPPSATVNPDSARFQLFDSVTTFFRGAASERRLLIILDDLQAADTPSLRYLRFLTSQLDEIPLVVLGTYRDVELTPNHPLTDAIVDLRRQPATRSIGLSGLPRDALRELIASSAGVATDDRVIAAVARVTKGNPLYVGETVRLLAAEGRLGEISASPVIRVAVPVGVRAVIGRRVARLPETTRRLLANCAVLGPEFGIELIRDIAQLDETALGDALDEAVAEGLLVEVSGAVGRFRFSHDLVRETLYLELAPGRRLTIHRRIAEVLEERSEGSPDAHLAALAYHLYEAEQGGAPSERAIDSARRAGERASRSLAFEEAARLYGLALAAHDRSSAPDPRARLDILLALGDAETRAGDPAARATLLDAAEVARRIGAAPELARAALGIGGRLPWARPGRETRLIPLLQDALVHLGGANDRLRVRLLSRLACAWRSTPDQRDQADSLSRQAVDLARRLDDPATLTYALAGRYWATWWPENPGDRAELAREMAVIADELGEGERLIDAHLMLWMSHTELGDMVAAHREAEDLRRLATDLRQPAHLWLGKAPRAMMMLLEGDFASAARLVADEADADARHYITMARDNVSSERFHRFLLRRAQGGLDQEVATMRASVEDFPWYPLHRAALAIALSELGRQAEAQHVLDELSRDAFVALYPDNEWLLAASLAAEACHRLGDRAAADALYLRLAPFAGRHAIGHAEGSVGAVDRYLGLLAATTDRLDGAVEHLEAGIEVNRRMGARPWIAYTEFDLAGVLRRRAQPGDSERAIRLEAAALSTARALGMTGLALTIGDVQVPSGSSPPDADASGATFRRDGEYWTIAFGADVFTLRDSKGLGYLDRLLGQPGREIHAVDLAGTVGASLTVTTAVLSEVSARSDGDAGAVLDAEAKAAYRQRVDELRADLDQAETWNDAERAASAQAELHALVAQLSSAVGIGGRDRRAASATERARISVTRAIKSALDRLASQSPALGAHLRATVRTGTYCSYTPDPRVPIDWRR